MQPFNNKPKDIHLFPDQSIISDQSIKSDHKQQISLKIQNIHSQNQNYFYQPIQFPIQFQQNDPQLAYDIKKYKQTTFKSQDWQQIQQSIKSDNIRQIIYGIIGLQKLFIYDQQAQLSKKIINSNILPYLINMLDQPQIPQLKLHVLTLLSNTSQGNSQQSQTLQNSKRQSLIMQILNQIDSQKTVLQVMIIIGNLALQNEGFKKQLINSGTINKLVKLISQKSQIVVDKGVWALSNICRINPLPQYNQVKQAVLFLQEMLVTDKITNQNSLQICLWAISEHNKYFETLSSITTIQTLLNRISQLIRQSVKSIILPSIVVLQKLIQFQSQISQKYIYKQGINLISRTLKNKSRDIKYKTISLLNIVILKYSNNKEIINKFIKTSIFQLLVQIFNNETVELKDKICKTFNLLSYSSEKMLTLKVFHQNSVMKHLIKSLQSYHRPLVLTVLQSLSKLLQFGQQMLNQTNENNLLLDDFIKQKGSQTLQNLQKHPDQNIYKKALQLIQRYFETQQQVL